MHIRACTAGTVRIVARAIVDPCCVLYSGAPWQPAQRGYEKAVPGKLGRSGDRAGDGIGERTIDVGRKRGRVIVREREGRQGGIQR